MYSKGVLLAASARLAAFALFASSNFARADQHIVCPAAVDAHQVRIDSPDGWVGIFGPEGTLQLRAVQAVFVAGSLRDGAWGELKDPPTARQGDAVIMRYPLPPEGDKYVICDYGQRVFQAMKLPAATTECAVVHKPVKGGKRKAVDYAVSDVICK